MLPESLMVPQNFFRKEQRIHAALKDMNTLFLIWQYSLGKEIIYFPGPSGLFFPGSLLLKPSSLQPSSMFPQAPGPFPP